MEKQLRKLLIEKYSIGIINLNNVIRVAFSAVAAGDVPELFEGLYKACKDLQQYVFVSSGNFPENFPMKLSGLFLQVINHKKQNQRCRKQNDINRLLPILIGSIQAGMQPVQEYLSEPGRKNKSALWLQLEFPLPATHQAQQFVCQE